MPFVFELRAPMREMDRRTDGRTSKTRNASYYDGCTTIILIFHRLQRRTFVISWALVVLPVIKSYRRTRTEAKIAVS